MYLHFIFSSCVPRVRRTSTDRTSLKERPLDELELFDEPTDPDDPTVAAAAVSNVLDANEPDPPPWPPKPE